MNHRGSRARRIVSVAFPPLKRAWAVYKAWRFRVMLDRFVADFGLVVQNGPFRGLKYLPESTGSSLLPKLLGSYEGALHPTISAVRRRSYDNVIDIGCAEGYYAVGLANCWPNVQVIAFDINPAAREMCRRLAEINGVGEQITVLGECTPEALAEMIGNKSLIICDCEGYEAELLDPEVVTGLNHCDLIVELHPFVDPAIPGLFESRFKNSHRSALVRGSGDHSEYPQLKTFRWLDRTLATYEERGGGEALWMVLTPRAAPDE